MAHADVIQHILESCTSTFDLTVGGKTHRYGCGQAAGHSGVHRFMIEWSEDMSSNEGPDNGN